MLHVGLTGNIAAGKSTVAELFRRWGATIIDADEIVRELQQPGGAMLSAIARRFGPGVLGADGALDRPALRARVLADPAELAALNALMHPAVAARRGELVMAARRRDRRSWSATGGRWSSGRTPWKTGVLMKLPRGHALGASGQLLSNGRLHTPLHDDSGTRATPRYGSDRPRATAARRERWDPRAGG